MTRSRSAMAVSLTALAPLLAQSQPSLSSQWRDDVQQFAQSLVDGQLVPGIGIAVTQGDSVVYSGAFGLADVASGRRADEGTAFYIASSTKALTATAVLALAARKELDLDVSVAHYLPALRGRGRLNADSVTLRDLLTMSHGIEDGEAVEFRTAYTGVFSPPLLLDLLAEYRRPGAPRQFRYGNLGYIILGLVLDSRDGHGWKDIVRREVMDPLGMRETSARVSDFEPDVIALPHEYGADGKFRRIRLGKADANMHAAGGHFATARDLGRFVAAHASSGRLDGVQVFSREMIASAHRKQIEQDRRYGPFQRIGWGFGWDLGAYGDEAIVSRFGAFSGYRSHMSFMPDRGTGVVVLVNGDGAASVAADVVATYIYDRLKDRPKLDAAYKLRVADLRALADASRYNRAKDLAERRARTAPLPRPLQDYAGVYENAKLGRMEWRVVAGELEVRMGVAYSAAEVFDAQQNRLRVSLTGDGEIVEFSFATADGSARAVKYRGETFDRVPPLHLVVLAGQSNMAGRGTVEAADRVPHPRVWVLDRTEHWVAAVDPLHFDKPIAGVGPDRSFGIALADAAAGVNIGLIPVAVGGSPIAAWEPGAVHSQTGSKPYDDAIRRIRAAKAAGEFKAILWHQGENDSGVIATPDYEARTHDAHCPVERRGGQPSETPWTGRRAWIRPRKPFRRSSRRTDYDNVETRRASARPDREAVPEPAALCGA